MKYLILVIGFAATCVAVFTIPVLPWSSVIALSVYGFCQFALGMYTAHE